MLYERIDTVVLFMTSCDILTIEKYKDQVMIADVTNCHYPGWNLARRKQKYKMAAILFLLADFSENLTTPRNHLYLVIFDVS